MRFSDRCKPVGVKELLTNAVVERLDKGIVGRLSRTRKIEFDPAPVRPLVELLGDEFGAVVRLKRGRYPQ